MPHGHCYFWQPDVLWPNVIGDAVTAVSYFAIPFILTMFVRRRDDLRFTIIYWAFVLFITACGITHLLAIISVWHPIYYIEGYMKLITGLVSFLTVVLLINKFSELLAVPSTEQLTRETYEELVLALPAEQDATLDLSSMPEAFGDESAIRQVLQNLISNGLKYSARREKSIIRAGGEMKEERPVYWVKDNGIGFDEQYKDKLFALFRRLHTQQDFEGTGVGLAISHRIIRKHGGQIWAESKKGEGATFYFELPKSKNHL